MFDPSQTNGPPHPQNSDSPPPGLEPAVQLCLALSLGVTIQRGSESGDSGPARCPSRAMAPRLLRGFAVLLSSASTRVWGMVCGFLVPSDPSVRASHAQGPEQCQATHLCHFHLQILHPLSLIVSQFLAHVSRDGSEKRELQLPCISRRIVPQRSRETCRKP